MTLTEQLKNKLKNAIILHGRVTGRLPSKGLVDLWIVRLGLKRQ